MGKKTAREIGRDTYGRMVMYDAKKFRDREDGKGRQHSRLNRIPTRRPGPSSMKDESAKTRHHLELVLVPHLSHY